MKKFLKKLPKSKMELRIKIEAEEFEKFYQKAIFSLGKDLEIAGFRKGKIPPKIIERKIGVERILKQAAEDAIRENYSKAILKEGIEVLGKPKVEILNLNLRDSFEFKATFSVFPEITLPDYKKIASEEKRGKISVSETEIEKTLSWLQHSRAKFTPKNLPVEKGDFIEIEYSSPQIEGGRKIRDGFFFGRGGFISGFENNLEGMRVGEERVFSLKFPKDYFQKNLAGKEVKFKAKAISIQKVKIPELNDEFAKSLGKFENLESLKRSIFEGIKMEKEREESKRIQKEILEKIARLCQFEIPEILIEEEKKRYLEDLKIRIPKIFKMSFEDYLNSIKKTEKEMMDSYHLAAEEKLKKSLILREIKKREKIEAKKEEIGERINKMISGLPPEKIKRLDFEILKEYIKDMIEKEKVLNFLESFAK
jgi:trigger factor